MTKRRKSKRKTKVKIKKEKRETYISNADKLKIIQEYLETQPHTQKQEHELEYVRQKKAQLAAFRESMAQVTEKADRCLRELFEIDD